MEDWNCTRCGGEVADFQQRTVLFDPLWDVLALSGYWPKWNAIFIVFRGTDSANLGNWIQNVHFLMTDYYDMPFPGTSHNAEQDDACLMLRLLSVSVVGLAEISLRSLRKLFICNIKKLKKTGINVSNIKNKEMMKASLLCVHAVNPLMTTRPAQRVHRFSRDSG